MLQKLSISAHFTNGSSFVSPGIIVKHLKLTSNACYSNAIAYTTAAPGDSNNL